MPTPETTQIARDVRRRLAGEALTQRQAKLYSQRLRLEMGQEGLAALMGHSNVRTTQRYVRATERNKREAVQAAMLNSRGHNLATRVNAITQNHAVA